MSKTNADQELLRLCAKLVEAAGSLAGMRKTGHLTNPCGFVIFVFSEKDNAIFTSGQLNPFVIAEFLIANCGFAVADPPTPMSPRARTRSADAN